MSEPTDVAEAGTELALAEPDYDEELSTSYLEPTLHSHEGLLDTTDWLALLTGKPPGSTVELDEEPDAQPQPSGMSDHLSPPRIRPTVGARLTTGVRRLVLLSLVAVVSLAAFAGGAYMLWTNPWVEGIKPAPVVQPVAPSLPKLAAPQQQTGTEAAPAQPVSGAPDAPLPPPQQAAVPGTPEDLRAKGLEALKAGDYTSAIENFETAISMDGGDAVTEYQLGLAYMGSPARPHAAEDAEMAFRTASSMQPAWGAPRQLLAESLMRRGFYKDAVPPAEEATRIDPDNAEAWMTLGRAYDGAGEKAGAASAYAEAARLAPAPPNSP